MDPIYVLMILVLLKTRHYISRNAPGEDNGSNQSVAETSCTPSPKGIGTGGRDSGTTDRNIAARLADAQPRCGRSARVVD